LHNFRADLHTHSYYSDGSLSPEALIEKAIEASLQALSITDHDTVAAYDRALPFAKQNNITLLAGIELSAYYKKHSVHILGYGFKLNHPALLQACEAIKNARLERNRIILDKLKQCHIIIEEAELESTFPYRTIGRPHIAQLMIQKGYVRNFKSAFFQYLGDSARCASPPLKVLNVPDAVHLIHEAGGLAVLAHPHVFKTKKLVNELLNKTTFAQTRFDGSFESVKAFDGFDGIEAYYSLSSPHAAQPMLDLAKTYSLITTGGSDFHGILNSQIPLGCSFSCETTFNKLYALHLTNN